MEDDRWLKQIAAATGDFEAATPSRAPTRLKAKIYSALVKRLSDTGPILSLAAIKSAGQGLCVFEYAIAVLPVGGEVKAMNPCRVCHARVLAERVEDAPIFWPNCPYSEFQGRSRK